MAQQVTLEEAAIRLPELVKEGQEIVLFSGSRPVAKLTPFNGDSPSAQEIAALAMAGGAFDWPADEPDIYDDAAGEAVTRVHERLRHWQQEFGLPVRPDGTQHISAQQLFTQWAAEDALLTPEEAKAEHQLWQDLQNGQQGVAI